MSDVVVIEGVDDHDADGRVWSRPVPRKVTTAELLSALSESPDVVCGECAGFGARRCGFCENDKDGLEDFPCHDPVSCSACGGSGLNPQLVEAMKLTSMAVAQTIAYSGEKVALTERNNRMMAAALRAFLSGGWIE